MRSPATPRLQQGTRQLRQPPRLPPPLPKLLVSPSAKSRIQFVSPSSTGMPPTLSGTSQTLERSSVSHFRACQPASAHWRPRLLALCVNFVLGICPALLLGTLPWPLYCNKCSQMCSVARCGLLISGVTCATPASEGRCCRHQMDCKIDR